MVSKVKKWGRGQGLRLPNQLLKLADIAIGDEVQLIAGKHQILVKKASKPKYDLTELLGRIPKNYRAQEVDFGCVTGAEHW